VYKKFNLLENFCDHLLSGKEPGPGRGFEAARHGWPRNWHDPGAMFTIVDAALQL